jgi:hypothetical protein
MKHFVLAGLTLVVPIVSSGCSNPTQQQQFVSGGAVQAVPSSESQGRVQPDAYYYVFILETGSQSVVKYPRNCGKRIAGFSTGTKDPEGIAVDNTGKVYIANGADNSVTTYVKQKPSTPVITTGIDHPLAVAVSNGIIYVANYGASTITTYNSDGSPAKLTITKGLDGPQGILIDNAGKIYVTNGLNNTLTTYTRTGAPTTPTIANLSDPYGIVVSHQPETKGYIFVANRSAGTIGVYTPTGMLEDTYTGLDEPEGMGYAQGGALFAANYGNGTLWSSHGYCRGGLSGLDAPSGVALEPINN